MSGGGRTTLRELAPTSRRPFRTWGKRRRIFLHPYASSVSSSGAYDMGLLIFNIATTCTIQRAFSRNVLVPWSIMDCTAVDRQFNFHVLVNPNGWQWLIVSQIWISYELNTRRDYEGNFTHHPYRWFLIFLYAEEWKKKIMKKIMLQNQSVTTIILT